MINLIKYKPYLNSIILIILYYLFYLTIEKSIIYLLNFETISFFLNKYIYFIDTIIYVVSLIVLFFYFRVKKTKFDSTINLRIIYLVIVTVLLLSGLEFIYNNFDFIFLKKEASKDIFVYEKIELFTDFINIVLLSSIFEELIFRKIIIDFFKKSNNIFEPVITSSVLFSLIHFVSLGFSFKSGLVFLIYGLFYGFLYFKTKNVLYPIIAHVTTNFIWLFLKINQNKYEYIIQLLQSSNSLIIITIILFLLATIFILKKINNQGDS